MFSKFAITTSLLVATASATFPPTDLQQCANLAGQAQTDCFQKQFDQQLAADAAAAAAASKKLIGDQQKAALIDVQRDATGLQGGLNGGQAATVLWCQGEFREFVNVAGADRCKQLCSQFAVANQVDTSSSQAAFECLLPLTTKAVDDAKNEAERNAAVDAKTKAGLLFIATQFQDKNNDVIIAANNKGHLVTDFSDKTKDLAFNSDERTTQIVLQNKAVDADKARATEAAANADPLEKAFATFFIPKLEVQPDVAASRDTLRTAQPFGDAATTVLNSADARFTVLGVDGQPANVVFTDLGQVDQAADATFATDLASFVTADVALVNPGTKRAPKATQVGSFGQNDDEILANKLALVTFCKVKGAACKSSQQGVVSEQQFKVAQVETKAEETARLEAEASRAAAAATTAKPTAKPNKGGNNNNNYGDEPAATKHIAQDGAASSLMVAAGAVVAAIVSFL